MNCKELEQKQSWHNLRYKARIGLECLRKTSNQNSRSPGRDMNMEPFGWEARVLSTRKRCSYCHYKWVELKSMVQYAFQASMKHRAGAVPCHQQLAWFCIHVQCASFGRIFVRKTERSCRFTTGEVGMKHQKRMWWGMFIMSSSKSDCCHYPSVNLVVLGALL